MICGVWSNHTKSPAHRLYARQGCCQMKTVAVVLVVLVHGLVLLVILVVCC